MKAFITILFVYWVVVVVVRSIRLLIGVYPVTIKIRRSTHAIDLVLYVGLAVCAGVLLWG